MSSACEPFLQAIPCLFLMTVLPSAMLLNASALALPFLVTMYAERCRVSTIAKRLLCVQSVNNVMFTFLTGVGPVRAPSQRQYATIMPGRVFVKQVGCTPCHLPLTCSQAACAISLSVSMLAESNRHPTLCCHSHRSLSSLPSTHEHTCNKQQPQSRQICVCQP